jgi:hypothetical protein
VVQVYLADPPSRNKWNKRCCGVVAFIKDNQMKSYFIRVYDIRVNEILMITLHCYDVGKFFSYTHSSLLALEVILEMMKLTL